MSHYVYWIRRPEHTDITTQGYVGVSNNPDYRWKQHNHHNSNCGHLRNALIKYDDVIMDLMVYCSEEQAYELEYTLRPSDNIGWNMVAGGGNPPSRRGKKNPWISGSKNKNAKYWQIKKLSPIEFSKVQNGQRGPNPRARSDHDEVVLEGWGAANQFAVKMGFDVKRLMRTNDNRKGTSGTKVHYKGYYLVEVNNNEEK